MWVTLKARRLKHQDFFAIQQKGVRKQTGYHHIPFSSRAVHIYELKWKQRMTSIGERCCAWGWKRERGREGELPWQKYKVSVHIIIVAYMVQSVSSLRVHNFRFQRTWGFPHRPRVFFLLWPHLRRPAIPNPTPPHHPPPPHPNTPPQPRSGRAGRTVGAVLK